MYIHSVQCVFVCVCVGGWVGGCGWVWVWVWVWVYTYECVCVGL